MDQQIWVLGYPPSLPHSINAQNLLFSVWMGSIINCVANDDQEGSNEDNICYVMVMVSQKFVLGASSTNLKKSKQESSAQLI